MEELITILGFAGIILTVITFVNPKVSADFYLNKHNKWEEAHLNLSGYVADIPRFITQMLENILSHFIESEAWL